MAKYIKCDCCGQRINFGDEIYFHNGYCGTYCSTECFTAMYGDSDQLTEEHAENCMCRVYDDDQVAKRKAQLKQQIAEMKNELARLEGE